MRFFHVVGTVSVLLALTATVSADDQTAAKVKNKHAVHAVVVDIQKDQDKDTGTLVVKLQPQKKAKGVAPSASANSEMKFQITAGTKFDKVVRVAKGEFKHEAASIQDVQKGAQVLIIPAGKKSTEAKTVELVSKKKTKSKGAEQQ